MVCYLSPVMSHPVQTSFCLFFKNLLHTCLFSHSTTMIETCLCYSHYRCYRSSPTNPWPQHSGKMPNKFLCGQLICELLWSITSVINIECMLKPSQNNLKSFQILKTILWFSQLQRGRHPCFRTSHLPCNFWTGYHTFRSTIFIMALVKTLKVLL